MSRTNKPVITFCGPLNNVDELESWLRNNRFTGNFYHRTNRNADGTPQRWRVNGQLKRWKRDRVRMYLPIKNGLYNTAQVTSLEEFNENLSIGYTATVTE